VSQRIIKEQELAALAKEFRERSGKNRAEAARELGIARPTVHQAEENPERSLTNVRRQLIEAYSEFELVGPVYLLRKR
jgi:DNA-binding XRE family transcriptional regulator